MAEVLVLIEEVNGELKKVSRELISAANKVGSASAVLVGAEGTADKYAEELKKAGAEKIYAAEGATATDYLVVPKVDVLAGIIESANPAAVFVAASTEGKEVSGRLAARLGAGLLVDAVEIKDDFSVVHSVFGGAYTAEASSTAGTPIISIRPGAIEIEEKEGAGEVVSVDLVEPDESYVKIAKYTPVEGGDRPGLTEASIVVSGGRGVGSEEKFEEVIEPLADAFGAAVGASRAAVDSGYYPGQFQVGQTGSTVSPQLYLALGISGAIQHRAGMQTSKAIVAVNTDEEAPIFEISDFGVVGNLFDVAPKLAELVKSHKG